jgi:hypothetical protein
MTLEWDYVRDDRPRVLISGQRLAIRTHHGRSELDLNTLEAAVQARARVAAAREERALHGTLDGEGNRLFNIGCSMLDVRWYKFHVCCPIVIVVVTYVMSVVVAVMVWR